MSHVISRFSSFRQGSAASRHVCVCGNQGVHFLGVRIKRVILFGVYKEKHYSENTHVMQPMVVPTTLSSTFTGCVTKLPSALSALPGNKWWFPKIKGTPIWTPKYYNPYYWAPPKRNPYFGKPPNKSYIRHLELRVKPLPLDPKHNHASRTDSSPTTKTATM